MTQCDELDDLAAAGLPTWWDRSWVVFFRWISLVMLAASTVFSMLEPGHSRSERLIILGLVVAAATWIVGMHVIPSQTQRERGWHAAAFLAVLLTLASVLMSRDVVFFIFAIAGFMHASPLRPLPLVFVGTGATSFTILYFTWGGIPSNAGEAVAFLAVLVIQTFLIGFGVAGGEKMTQLGEERRQTVARLEATLAENEALHAQLVTQAREAGVRDERQRMAREIHDTLAQGLTGVITQLEAADQRLDDPTALSTHLKRASELARTSLTEARRSVQALGPGALEQGRLPDALDDLARQWSETSGVRADASTTGASANLPAAVEVELLRIAQEALANAAKHADATRVGITLSCWDDAVTLDVRDDGRGFDPDGPRDGDGFGLTGMGQRMTPLGGTLVVESEPGGGTVVSATVPLDSTAAPGG